MLSKIFGRIPFRNGRSFVRIVLKSGRSSGRSAQQSFKHSRTQSNDESSGCNDGLIKGKSKKKGIMAEKLN